MYFLKHKFTKEVIEVAKNANTKGRDWPDQTELIKKKTKAAEQIQRYIELIYSDCCGIFQDMRLYSDSSKPYLDEIAYKNIIWHLDHLKKYMEEEVNPAAAVKCSWCKWTYTGAFASTQLLEHKASQHPKELQTEREATYVVGAIVASALVKAFCNGISKQEREAKDAQ